MRRQTDSGWEEDLPKGVVLGFMDTKDGFGVIGVYKTFEWTGALESKKITDRWKRRLRRFLHDNHMRLRKEFDYIGHPKFIKRKCSRESSGEPLKLRSSFMSWSADVRVKEKNEKAV